MNPHSDIAFSECHRHERRDGEHWYDEGYTYDTVDYYVIDGIYVDHDLPIGPATEADWFSMRTTLESLRPEYEALFSGFHPIYNWMNPIRSDGTFPPNPYADVWT